MVLEVASKSKKAKAAITPKEQRKLHAKSGNRCAKCKTILVEPGNSDAACIGQNAHIYGEKPDAARYDASKSETYVNSEQNLIFLCCNCHKIIDTEVEHYPPEFLFEIKESHEAWVTESLTASSTNFTFAELEVLTTYLIGNNGLLKTPDDYTLLKISDKMQKNHLNDVQMYINLGLSSVITIEDYLNRHPDQNFASRVASSISGKYCEFKKQNMDPVDIFYSLWDITCGQHKEFNYKAAGLGILVYFFEKCEVFEK